MWLTVQAVRSGDGWANKQQTNKGSPLHTSGALCSIHKRFHEEFVPRLAEVTEEELCTGGTAGQGRPFPPLCLANEPSYLNEEQHWKSLTPTPSFCWGNKGPAGFTQAVALFREWLTSRWDLDSGCLCPGQCAGHSAIRKADNRNKIKRL